MDFDQKGEKRLIQQAATDPAAFSILYRHYFPKIYGYVMYRVDNQHDAEDLVSEVFTKMLEGLHGFDYRGEGSFAAWLFRIAQNAVVSFYRRQARTPDAILDDDELADQNFPDKALLHQEQATLIRQLVKTLSRQRRQVVSLKFFGDLRNQEIAELLGLNERTVASHLCRAIEDLRARYQQASRQEGEKHE